MIKKHEKYWADLLEQYKLGSISKSDRFELEKRALDDPFLFDALEGFSTVPQETVILKEDKAKLLTLPRMAAAASVLFLVSMIFLLKKDKAQSMITDKAIAMVLDKNANESLPANEEEREPESEVTISKSKDLTESSSFNKIIAETEAAPIRDTNNQKKLRKKDKIINDEVVTLEKSNSRSTKLDNIPTNNSEVTSIHKNDALKIKTDDSNLESIQDEIHISNSLIKKEVNIDKTQLEWEYTESRVPAIVGSNVHSPITKAKNAKKEIPSTFHIVTPAIGVKDFEENVKNSIDKQGLRQTTPHAVIIEFDIDKNGLLSNFLHINNGCPECGDYAIHLLRSSGVWKTSPEGKEGRARYILKF